MMKRFLCFLVALVLLAVAGCAVPQSSSRGQERTLALKTASCFPYEPLSQAYQELSRNYASYFGVEIADSSSTDPESYIAGTVNAFAAGEEPDVFYFPLEDAQTMIDNGQVVSLEEIRSVYPRYGENIQPALLQDMADANGNAWCIPVRGSYQALFCNTALFEAHALPLPTTWPELLRAVDTFSRAGVVPIAAGFTNGASYWTDHMLLASSAEDFDFSPLPGDSVPASWRYGLVELTHLGQRNAFPAQADTTDFQTAVTLFAAGEAAMLLGPGEAAFQMPDHDRVEACCFPNLITGSQGPQLIAQVTDGYFISRKAWENDALRDAAVQFVLYMSSNSAIDRMSCNGAGYVTYTLTGVTPRADDRLTASAFRIFRQARIHTSMENRLTPISWYILHHSVPVLLRGHQGAMDVLNQVTQNHALTP